MSLMLWNLTFIFSCDRYIFHGFVVQYSVSEQFNNGKLTCTTNFNYVFHSYCFTAVHLQPKHSITKSHTLHKITLTYMLCLLHFEMSWWGLILFENWCHYFAYLVNSGLLRFRALIVMCITDVNKWNPSLMNLHANGFSYTKLRLRKIT
jgi:hypothetical protein